MMVLGVDPGSVTIGWALLDDDTGTLTLRGMGVWALQGPTPTTRLLMLVGRWRSWRHEWGVQGVDLLGIEDQFVDARNLRSGLKVAAARGWIEALVATLTPPPGAEAWHLFAPATLKSEFAGRGGADKAQMVAAARQVPGASDWLDAIAPARQEHAADALAAGWVAYGHHHRYQQLKLSPAFPSRGRRPRRPTRSPRRKPE